MGGVDVGGGRGKRNVNSDINMVPFIDLLLVTIAFLLITAVWVTFSRMNANAQVPGPPDPDKPIDEQPVDKVLHLHINTDDFSLVWKQGATVVSETSVTKPDMSSAKAISYGDLGKKIGEEWKSHGGHQDASDKKTDQAIVYADNSLKFKEVVAVLDALYATKRQISGKEGKLENKPVFNMAFSAK